MQLAVNSSIEKKEVNGWIFLLLSTSYPTCQWTDNYAENLILENITPFFLFLQSIN